MAAELLTRQELADRFGVDVRTVTNWVQDGMPQRKRSGVAVYSWSDCYRWREQRIRDDERATRHAGGNTSRKEQMAEARLRVALAEAEQAELDLAERRGQLVTVDFMVAELERITDALRGKLLALPPTWAAQLASKTGIVEIQLSLQDLVNELMPALRAAADDDAEDATVDQDGGREPGADESDASDDSGAVVA